MTAAVCGDTIGNPEWHDGEEQTTKLQNGWREVQQYVSHNFK